MTETNGPDPRNTIDCCDPCLYVRGGGNLYIQALLEHVPGGQPNPVAECCRCIPRAVMFRFTPDDYAANCCYPQSHLVHPILENVGGWLKAVYQADVFGLTFELSVGRFPLSEPYEDFDPYGYCSEDAYDPYAIGFCAWRLRVFDGAELLSSEIFPITEGSDCLTPPAVEYGPISYPPHCDEYSVGGLVTFEPFDKDKLAYLSVDNVVDEYSLIDLCPSDCGGETPDCLAVQDDNVIREYAQIADVGGFPAWQFGTNTIQWDSGEGVWLLLDGGSAELARGGTDSDCPLGIWTPADPYAADVFCVSLCHSEYDAYDETDVAFVCGQCTQAGRTVCVSGNWRENGWEFLQFAWVKRLVAISEGFSIQQGWFYTDPVTDATEYLWLVDNDTGCQLETEFTVNDFAPITITTGCSCDLFQESHTQPWPGNVFWYSVHSGFCTEFGFYCGSCRCVPTRLCLFYALDGVVTDQLEILWDEELKQWGDDEVDDITIHLEAGAYDDCELVVYYQGAPLFLWVPVDYTDPLSLEVYEQQVSVYDCQKEIWTAHTDDEFDHPSLLPDKEGVRLTHRLKCRKPFADFIGLSHEGFLTQTGGFLFLNANSAQDQNCVMVTCDSFFREACPNACIDQPQTLNATLLLRSDDYPQYGEEWSLDVELHLVVQYQGVGFPTFFCAYIGTAVVECEIYGETVYEAWTIRSQEGGFSLHVKYWVEVDGVVVPRQHIKVFDSGVDVSCNPIYAETGFEPIGQDPFEFTPETMCTDGLPEADRPSEVNLIITE